MVTMVVMGLRQYFQRLNLESLVMEESNIMVQVALLVWEGTTSKVPLVLSWIPITILVELILLIKHLPIQGV